MPDSLSRAQAEIRAVLAHSRTVEDAHHAEDTLAWLMRLRPAIDPALALAALGHDIDRVNGARAVQRADYASYAEFKDAHAECAARTLHALLERCKVSAPVTRRACWLVAHHESGGDHDADLLRDADNLSWFRVNLPAYLAREGRNETRRRCRWGYECLSSRARRCFIEIQHDSPRLDALLRDARLPNAGIPSHARALRAARSG